MTDDQFHESFPNVKNEAVRIQPEGNATIADDNEDASRTIAALKTESAKLAAAYDVMVSRLQRAFNEKRNTQEALVAALRNRTEGGREAQTQLPAALEAALSEVALLNKGAKQRNGGGALRALFRPKSHRSKQRD